MFRRQWSIQSAIWETELQERKIIIMALVVSVSIVTMTWRPHLAIFCTTLSHTPYKLQLPTEPPQSPPPCTVHAVCNGDTAMSHTGTRHYKMFLCIQQSLTTNSRIMIFLSCSSVSHIADWMDHCLRNMSTVESIKNK